MAKKTALHRLLLNARRPPIIAGMTEARGMEARQMGRTSAEGTPDSELKSIKSP